MAHDVALPRSILPGAHLPRKAVLWGLACVALLAGCVDTRVGVKTETEYQAVLLSNGHLFYGRLERADSAYPVLRDVYYFQSQVNPETKQVSSTLLKRGREFHAPAVMYLNRQHIVLVESVSPDSQVAQFINQLKQQGVAPQTPAK